MENQTQSRQKNKKSNKSKRNPIWKWLFLVLLAINLAGLLFVTVRVLTPRDQAVLTQDFTSKTDQKVAQITSSLTELNPLINRYLEDFQTPDMSYKFYISDQAAVLEASYQLFGAKIPFYVYFEPLALPNGAISLSVKSISAGSLNLPTSAVLDLMASYHLPNFVQVDSKNAQVIVNLPKIELTSKLYLKVNQIDLTKGNFVFDLMKNA